MPIPFIAFTSFHQSFAGSVQRLTLLVSEFEFFSKDSQFGCNPYIEASALNHVGIVE